MPVPAIFRRLLPTRVMSLFSKPVMLQKVILAYTNATMTYQLLPNPSEAIRQNAPAEGIKYFRRVRRTLGAVSGIVKLRIDAVMALPHQWVPGDVNDPESVDWCEGVKQAWNQIRWRDVAFRKLMFCVPDGLSLAELIYGPVEIAITVKPSRENPNPANIGKIDRVETWIVPTQIVDLPVEKFGFDADFKLRFRPRGTETQGELVDEMQILLGRYGSAALYGEPEMEDIVADAWKLDWIDREGLKALERSGYPLAQVTVPEGWDEERIKSTMIFAEYTYKNFMIVRMGDRFEISFPDESVRPTFIGADQVTRIRQIQDDISIGYLGVSFSNAETGAKARDQVRNEMRFEKTSGDASVYDELCRQWEEKVRQVNRPNMPLYKRAVMRTDYMPTQDVVTRANVYVQMVGVGYPASVQQASEEFGLRPAMFDGDKLQKPVTAPAQVGAGRPRTGGMNPNVSDPSQNDSPDLASIGPEAN